MKVFYTENEKRHIFESETGHMSTFLKERVTKEQAEVLFQAQLANEGITTTVPQKVTEPEVLDLPLLEEEVIPTAKPTKKSTKNA
jgi:hypothetical protein